MNFSEMNRALEQLLGKYSVAPAGEIISAETLETANGRQTLLPWRCERRFVELKNLATNGTLERISTLRFASISAGGDLRKQLAREFDLAAWIAGQNVVSVFAACAPGDCAVNAIAGFSGGIKASVECSAKLPPGAESIDRHEVIAARGVASDRGVDTQVPQSSLYVYNMETREICYTDVDAELFGFSVEETGVIRAAFAVLSSPGELEQEWRLAALAADRCVEAVFESDRAKNVIRF